MMGRTPEARGAERVMLKELLGHPEQLLGRTDPARTSFDLKQGQLELVFIVPLR